MIRIAPRYGKPVVVATDTAFVPFEFKRSSDFAYYLVYPPEAIRRRKIKAFRDWLMPLADLGPRGA